MAQDLPIYCAAGTYTLLTNSDVTSVTIQNKNGRDVELIATVGAVAPTTLDSARRLGAHETLASDLTLAQLWPGVVGANRVYAYSEIGMFLSVSHA